MISTIYFLATLWRRFSKKRVWNISIGFNTTLMWMIFPSKRKWVNLNAKCYTANGSTKISTEQSRHLKFSDIQNIESFRFPTQPCLCNPTWIILISSRPGKYYGPKTLVFLQNHCELKGRRYNLKNLFTPWWNQINCQNEYLQKVYGLNGRELAKKRLNLISILGFCGENNQENCFANSLTSTAELFTLAIELLPPDSS